MSEQELMNSEDFKYPCLECEHNNNCRYYCVPWQRWFEQKWREVVSRLTK